MEEGQTSKRRRVYSFEPNNVLRAIFSQKYLNFLLPALLKISRERSCDEKKECEIEKSVRFEVDMALVLSADTFGWSRALKRKLLESDMNMKHLHAPTQHQTSLSLLLTYKPDGTLIINKEKANHISPMLPLPRQLTPIGFSHNCNSSPSSEKLKMSKRGQWGRRRTREKGEKEEFGCRLKTLRKLLPGGDEMGVNEMLSEVESYVVCLELQVSILQSLVDTH